MNEIALHIDFLLHTHDCIIVPGLGGFVVNETGVEKNGLWGLDAPTFELIFNNKLTYNDGLLAESLMKTNNISYKVAIKQIEAACDELKSKVQQSEGVAWDNLGTFKISKENNIIFLPNKDYVRPKFFGLSNSRLKPIALALSSTSNKENSIPIRTAFQYVSTAVVAAVVMFFVVVSYYNGDSTKSQHAEIVSKPLVFNQNKYQSTTTPKTDQVAIVPNSNSQTTSTKEVLPATTATASENTTVQSQSQSSSVKYYIVVGVYEVRDVAEKTLSALKSKGFSTASMIERPRRLDVYSAAFSDRKEARTFLLKFQAENPRYADAWILKR